jgi:hypothetical protein
MKKFFKSIPAALALVALASCSSDDLFNSEAVSQAVDGQTMTASIEGYGSVTRSAFAENKTDGKADKRALVWTAGDSYKVYGELSTPDKYTLQNSSVGKANGVFDLMTEDYNENPAFAVFPYDKVDADRANKKLTVTLSDWTYATAEVKDEGYSEGGFVSNVPMFGKIAAGAPKEAKFGYMTAILRVDLQKLPKRTTRLIIVTDRPLTGTFETSFDPDGDYPEIQSPKGNSSEWDVTTLLGTPGAPANGYVMAIATEPVSERTNKTFFIAVPTGNKYDKFDIWVEYNMGGSTQTELIDQLGVTARKTAGKSILNWQRGKVKSLTKEITVTASGNTPKDLADFLKSEWKSFPEGADINITVYDPVAKDYGAIDLSTPAKNTFTVPAEVVGKTINIIVPEFKKDGTTAITDAFTGGTAMTIEDDDKAPIASDALRQLNIIGKTSANVALTLDCPETQVSLEPLNELATGAATYGAISSKTALLEGLFVAENVTTGAITISGGELVSEGVVGNIINNSDEDVTVKGNAGTITSNQNGAINVEGKLDFVSNPTSGIVKSIGQITAKGKGAVSVKNVLAVDIANGLANETGAISIENVNEVTSLAVTTNTNHAEAISIKKVLVGGIKSFSYAGKGAVTFDDVVGGSTTSVAITNATTEADFTMSNIKDGATWTSVSYAGKGNVSITGVTTTPATPVYPTITALTTNTTATPLTAGDVTLNDVTIGTSLTKNSQGALTINGVRAAFGTITNADGAISVTGNNVSAADITSITQNGTGNITLKDISDAVTLTGAPNTPGQVLSLTANKETTISYENTFIKSLVGNTAGLNYNVTANGTKSSGIGSVTKNQALITFTTDAWDGSSWCKVPTANIYTSGSFASLMYSPFATTTADLWVSNSEIDLASKVFQLKIGTTTYRGINAKITQLNGGKYTNIAGPISFTVKNLKAATGLFASSATTARSAALAVEYFTLDAPTITSTANAGALIGTANGNDFKFTAVNVKNATIASASTGKGTDINLGGFIGEVNAPSQKVQLWGCNVATATISGHYYMGGFIGQVTDANLVEIKDILGKKDDKKGSTVSGITFNPKSNDGVWSTLKCGTIAPFIGGINRIDDQSATPKGELNIYGKFDTFERESNMWKMNFLSNESFKFIGTKQDDCNFVGYINVAMLPTAPKKPFQFFLKNLNGFEADVAAGGMTILSGGGAGKAYDEILATECNAYAEY